MTPVEALAPPPDAVYAPPAPRALPGPPARAFIPGIGEPLPPGETLLWTGGPATREIARRVCHTRGVCWYFGALAALVVIGAGTGGGLATSTAGVLTLGVMALAVLGFSRVYAALVARTTVYAITDRRLVLRIGVAIPAVLNIPLEQIDSVDLRGVRAGAGDVTVSLGGGARVAYLLLWPHARPWRYSRPEPALRGIAGAARVGAILAEAVRTRLAVLAERDALALVSAHEEVA